MENLIKEYEKAFKAAESKKRSILTEIGEINSGEGSFEYADGNIAQNGYNYYRGQSDAYSGIVRELKGLEQ